MKKLYTIIVILLFTVSVFYPKQANAQSPKKISYQAVIRDASNDLILNKMIGMNISILQDSVDGAEIYSEIQTPYTNDNGLISIQIGNDIGFDTITWTTGPYFIKTDTDPDGGDNYTITGVNQLLSVPFALHAYTADSITGTIPETDPVYKASVAAGITASDSALWNRKTQIKYIDGDQIMEIKGYSDDFDAVRTVTLNAPTDGVCLVIAYASVAWQSENFDVFRGAILCDENPNNSSYALDHVYDNLILLTDLNCSDATEQYSSFSQDRCFPVKAGSHSFTLWGNKYSSIAAVSVEDANLSVIFIPSTVVTSTKNTTKASKAIKQEDIVTPVRNYDSIDGN